MSPVKHKGQSVLESTVHGSSDNTVVLAPLLHPDMGIVSNRQKGERSYRIVDREKNRQS